MPSRDEVVEQALRLSPDDRAFVADALEQSLAAPAFATQEIAEAWNAEIDRRIAAYESAGRNGVDFDEAIQTIRQYLKAHRARSVPS